MWNILIVIIIAVIVFAFNPLSRINSKLRIQPDKETQNEVNQVVNDVQQQVNQARQIQQEEQNNINN